jgi:predicted CoA-substrate-specific enzyme activase
MGYFAGIDVGSLSTEVVLLDDSETVCAYHIALTGANPGKAVEESLTQALGQCRTSRDQIEFSVVTGYGRVTIPFADKKVTEITCHALGAHQLFPDTETVIDIGGQDSKVIRISREGKVLDFTMNDKCAAGTGRFLEVMAATFQMPIDTFGSLCLEAEQEVPISSVCTVFAESEVISLIAQSKPRGEIIRGLHRAVVNRIWSMVQTVGAHGAVTMSGGVAKNPCVVRLLEDYLKRSVHIHTEPQIVGALGAALVAKREALKS